MRREDRHRPLRDRLVRDGVITPQRTCPSSIVVPVDPPPGDSVRRPSRHPYMPTKTVWCTLKPDHDGDCTDGELTWKKKERPT